MKMDDHPQFTKEEMDRIESIVNMGRLITWSDGRF